MGEINQSQGKMEDMEASEEGEENLIVDPEDPLYGLEQRLKHSALDKETKEVIKVKLLAA